MFYRHLPHFCPEIAREETWRFTMPSAQGGLPAGDYVFLESYCDEVGCDCRRVWLAVMYRAAGRPYNDLTGPLATIGFGWEPPAFYERWFQGVPDAGDMAGARLEPLQPQGARAERVLALTKAVILAYPANVQRLKDHYAAVMAVKENPAERRT